MGCALLEGPSSLLLVFALLIVASNGFQECFSSARVLKDGVDGGGFFNVSVVFLVSEPNIHLC